MTLWQRQQKNFRVMLIRVAAADAYHARLRRNGNAVAQWPWKFADDLPRPVGFFQGKHTVIPDLPAPFPWLLVRKVCAASHNQIVTGNAGKGARKTLAVRQCGEFRKLRRGG